MSQRSSSIAVVGLGEVGKPLFELMKEHHAQTIGIDIATVDAPATVDVMHVCYPFEIADFVGETARYIERFKPSLTVINSTVGIGTTRAVATRTGSRVVNSPVLGKHVRMLEEMKIYTKFIGALDTAAAELAVEHFHSVGVKSKVLASPEATELAKLSETTYFGLLIAWAQEVERYCDQAGQNYDEVVSFYEEIKYLPRVKFWPGTIGGHCVLPNIEILSKFTQSQILDAIRDSNQMKVERGTTRNVAVGVTS